jgi:DNA repair protein RadC
VNHEPRVRAKPMRRMPPVPLPEVGTVHGVPVYTVRLHLTPGVSITTREQVADGDIASRIAMKHFAGADREHFAVMALDARNRMIGIQTVGIGSLHKVGISPREVFKFALLMNACAIILMHNHPSGDPTPSPEDVAVTHALAKVGDEIGVRVIDHIVVGEDRGMSMLELGLMEAT